MHIRLVDLFFSEDLTDAVVKAGVERAHRVDRVDNKGCAVVCHVHHDLALHYRFALGNGVLVKVEVTAAGHIFKGLVQADRAVKLCRENVALRSAVKVAARIVASVVYKLAASGIRLIGKHLGKIALHRKIGIDRLGAIGQKLCELTHPLALFLEVKQVRAALGKVGGKGDLVKPCFLLPSGAAIVAVAVLRPEKHIVEHTLYVKVVEHLLDLRFDKRAVFGIVRAKVSVSSASFAAAFAVGTV